MTDEDPEIIEFTLMNKSKKFIAVYHQKEEREGTRRDLSFLQYTHTHAE